MTDGCSRPSRAADDVPKVSVVAAEVHSDRTDLDAKYWVGLRLIPAIEAYAARLVEHLGSARAAWRAGLKALTEAGLREDKAQFYISARRDIDLDQEMRRLAAARIYAVTPADHRYPQLLRETQTPPRLLFVRGELLFRHHLAVSIVGARRATAYGRSMAEEIARDLSETGVTVVSGLARGIDGAAHQGAVRGPGGTIGVLGCGIDLAYPRRNQVLQDEIGSCGSLVSEYPLGREALPRHFPARNRIISGLSVATVVVEAGEKSGALITVDFALEQGREVFAVPGHSRSPMSKGCHNLIKQGAHLAESAADVLGVLGLDAKSSRREEDLTGEERRVLDALGWEAVTTDRLTQTAGLDAGSIAAILTVLEVRGLVKRDLGDRILRIR